MKLIISKSCVMRYLTDIILWQQLYGNTQNKVKDILENSLYIITILFVIENQSLLL